MLIFQGREALLLMNANRPFFSVVIPVYNVEKYLLECVDSVINQGFKDYEVILVDDGSSDKSAIICDRFERENPEFVKVFHKKNEGLLKTRLFGVERASGDYIVSLDSDDFLRDDALQLLYNTIRELDSDLVFFNASQTRDFKTKWKKIPLESRMLLDIREIYDVVCSTSSLNNLVLEVFKREHYVTREYVERFPNVKHAEDLLQTLYIIDKCKKPVHLDEALYYYRPNENSITHTFQLNIFASISSVGNQLLEFAKQWDNGTDTLVEKVYIRNLKSCARILRIIATSNEEKELKHQIYDEIRISQFLETAYSSERHKELTITERAILSLCKKHLYCLLDVLGKFVH